MLLLSLAIAAALWEPTGLGWAGLSALLIAFGSVQVGLVGHDAGHLAVFNSRRANWALGSVCWSLCLGVGFWYWSDRHNRHHASTNDLGADPDLRWAELVAYTETSVHARPPRARRLVRYQAILGPCFALGLAFAFRVESWVFTARHLSGRRRLAEAGLLGLSTALWMLPAVARGPGWLGVFLLAQVLAGLYLALAIAPNHKGMPTWPAGTPVSFLDRQVRGSRNVAPHPLTDFLMGGLNYQIEHHLFPTMPRSAFGRARAIVKPFCLARGLPYTEMTPLASYRLVLTELRRVGRLAAARPD
jgi:fatty acid desaturase